MSVQDLAIDLGTSYTTIYKKGAGLVLHEPTVAAISGSENGKNMFFGSEAKRLIGKTSENTTVVFPVFEGVIVNFNAAVGLIKNFLEKVLQKSFFKPNIRALISCPCGLPAEEKLKLEDAATQAGIREVNIIDAPMSGALGLGVPLSGSTPVFITDIGGGTTDAAVLTLSGIITGCSVSVGGNNVDTGIIDFISQNYGLKIGLLTAEKIKTQIGSLYKNDNTSMMISGTSASTGTPESMLLTSKNINPIIEFYYDKILDVLESILNSLPPEVSAEVRAAGLYIYGGGSLVPGLDKYFYKRLQIPLAIAEEPAYCNILGCGKLLFDNKLMQKLTGLA